MNSMHQKYYIIIIIFSALSFVIIDNNLCNRSYRIDYDSGISFAREMRNDKTGFRDIKWGFLLC